MSIDCLWPIDGEVPWHRLRPITCSRPGPMRPRVLLEAACTDRELSARTTRASATVMSIGTQ